MKIRQIIGWVGVGLLLILGAVIGFCFVGYSFSAVLCVLGAAVLSCYQLLALWAAKHKKSAKMLRLILSSALSFAILAAAGTGLYIAAGFLQPAQGSCDYVIVLGARVNGTTPSLSLRERLEAAYDYLAANPKTVCVVSGGQGGGEDISEAACMYQYLTGRGIDPERIVQEDRSTSTSENLRFSLELIQSKTGVKPQTVGIVSSEYHLFRAGQMAKDLGVDPVGIAAKTGNKALFVNYFLREIPALWKYIIFGG